MNAMAQQIVDLTEPRMVGQKLTLHLYDLLVVTNSRSCLRIMRMHDSHFSRRLFYQRKH